MQMHTCLTAATRMQWTLLSIWYDSFLCAGKNNPFWNTLCCVDTTFLHIAAIHPCDACPDEQGTSGIAACKVSINLAMLPFLGHMIL